MKKLLLGMIALMLNVGFSFAADVPNYIMPTKAAAAANTDRWSGFYGFGQIGVGQTRGRAVTDGYPSSTDTYKVPVQKCYSWEEGGEKCYNVRHEYVTFTNTTPGQPGAYAEDNVIGLLAGAGLGYSKRAAQTLWLGIEADGVYSFMNGYINGNGGTIQHRVPYILSLTGRVIYVPTSMPNTGFYLKGGLAVAKLQTSINGADSTQTRAGWTIGGGIEHQFPNLGISGRVETMYTKVPDQVVPFSGGVSTLKGDIWAVKAILSHPFGL